MAILKRVWRLLTHSEAQQRLEAALEAWQAEARQIVGNSEEPWAKEARALYEGAERAIATGDSERAWQNILAADRLSLHGLDDPGLRAAAASILAEAEAKLEGWRKKAVLEMLTHDGKLRERVHVSQIRQASTHLHERHSNLYRRVNAVRRQLVYLTIISASALLSWFQVSPKVNVALAADLQNRELMVCAAVLGILGASVSGIVSLAQASMAGDLQERLLSLDFTLARPATGAVAAVAVYVLMHADVLPALGGQAGGGVLAYAFVSGFSERFLTNAVSTLK
ncbi:MAG: hypothetical protein ACOZNI_19975 [Myxococcota bacterium]